MALGDLWSRTLVYFGIAEEEDWDEDGYLTDEELQRAYADRPNVRRLAPRRSSIRRMRVGSRASASCRRSSRLG